MERFSQRYRLIRQLDTGGSGKIYLAEKLHPEATRFRSRVARSVTVPFEADAPASDTTLVVLKIAHPSTEAQDAVFRELSLLSQLYHPHIVRLLDFGSLEGNLFLANEWIEGPSIDRWAADKDDSAIAQVIVQICRALQLIHGWGLIHGDIKPANILVEKGPSAKLVDFGLAGPNHQTSGPGISGTLRFIAPEIFNGASPSPASDLYSLGVTLDDILPAPESRLREISRWLQAQEPSQRPASIDQVVSALEQICQTSWALSSTELAGPYFPSFPFIGRETELAQLTDLTQGTAFILGPEGIGKTKLLHQLRIHWMLHGAECLWGEHTMAAGPLPEIVQALNLVWIKEGRWQERINQIVDQLVYHLMQMPSPRPVIFLDGIDGQDEISLRFLERINQSSLRCYVTVDESAWSSRLQHLAEGGLTLKLSGLSPEEIAALLPRILPNQQHSRRLVAEIHSVSQGNPLFLQKLLRIAIECQKLTPREKHYRIDIPWNDKEAYARTRLAGLSESHRRLLQELALCFQGMPEGLRSIPVELEQRGLVSRFEGMVRITDQWLGDYLTRQLEEPVKVAAHQHLARLLAELKHRPLLWDLELAEQLAHAGQKDEAAWLFFRIATEQQTNFDLSPARFHFERCIALASPSSALNQTARLELARILRLMGHYEKSIAIYHALLDEKDRTDNQTEEAGKYALELAETLLVKGDHEAVIASLSSMPEQESQEIVTRACCLRARALIQQGNYPAAKHQAQSGLQCDLKLQRNYPSLMAELKMILGLCHWRANSAAEATHCLDHALQLFRTLHDLPGMIRTINAQGLLWQQQGNLRQAGEAYRQCLELATQIGDRQLQMIAILNAGTVAQQRSSFEEALHYYHQGLLVAQSICLPREIGRFALNLGNILLQLGSLAEAAGLLNQAQAIAASLKLKELEAQALLFLAEGALYETAYDRATQLVEQSAQHFKELESSAALAEAHLLQARIKLRQGRWDEALVGINNARQLFVTDPLKAWSCYIEGETLLNLLHIAGQEGKNIKEKNLTAKGAGLENDWQPA